MLFSSSGSVYTPCQDDLFASDWEYWETTKPPEPVTHKIGNFQCALTAIKGGAQLQRPHWGREIWIEMDLSDPPMLRYRTSHGLVPWSARNADLFAEDWQIIS
jgi:hypothetical protein